MREESADTSKGQSGRTPAALGKQVSLDEKLREILYVVKKSLADDVQNWVIPQIKAAFAEAGYVTPENAAKVQTMVNQMANLANDAFQLPSIQYVKPNKTMTKVQNLMTGQEAFERLEKAGLLGHDLEIAREVLCAK